MQEYIKTHPSMAKYVFNDTLIMPIALVKVIKGWVLQTRIDPSNLFYTRGDVSNDQRKRTQMKMLAVTARLAMTPPMHLPNYNPKTKTIDNASFREQ